MGNGTGGGLAERVIEGQQHLVELRTSAGLRRAAAALADAADRLGCRDLYPASSQASAVTAVAVASNDSLRVVTVAQVADGDVDKVVVVEAVAISGLQVRRAVAALRTAGAQWVSVVVLTDLTDGADGSVRFGQVEQLANAV